MGKGQGGINFLESSLRCELGECTYLAQFSRPMLFNSAELICSHGGECLKVRADLLHLNWCSTLLEVLVARLRSGDAHISQAIPARFLLAFVFCLPSVSAFFICSICVGRTRMLTCKEGQFKLPMGHSNLVAKSALLQNIKSQLDDHIIKPLVHNLT